jgi:hypothetical protein
MKARGCTQADMEKALKNVNKKYKGNIIFKTFFPVGKQIQFTLTVKSSYDPGARRGFQGQRVAAACWHAHGDYFDALFKVNEKAEVYSGDVAGGCININGGNWQDRQIGSIVNPLYYSEACDCGKG